MKMTEGANGELLRFIATTVEALRDRVESQGGQVESLSERMATKDDLIGLREEITAVRSEAKADRARLEARMDAGFLTVRGDLERVNLRLDSIDRALSTRMSQVETDVSRIRSVVYLLAKNQPDLLRLLGSAPPLV
jgi:hypothetical protein